MLQAEDKAKKEEEEELRLALLEQRQAKLEYQQLLKKKHRHREQHDTPRQREQHETTAATPVIAAVANGSTSCKAAAPVGGRTVTVVTQPEKPRPSFGAVVSTNDQRHRLPTPVVAQKKSCHSVVPSEYKPAKGPVEAPCPASQPLTRRQPQQGDRTTKKLASKHPLPSAGGCGCSSNVDDGSPRRTPAIKVKKSADAIDVHAHNRWNKQPSQVVMSRPQQTNHCSQAKSARQNCTSGAAAHKCAVSNGPVTGKTCASINCGGRTTQNCDTASRVAENKNHHVANKDQTACLQRLMQQHNISAVAKPCHNFTDPTSSHQTQPMMSRKKGHKLFQSTELGSHLPTQPPAVPSRSGRPATTNYNNVDRHHDPGQCGHSSLANNVAALSLTGPPGQDAFENVAWKQDRKQPPVTASRSKGDVERATRDNGQVMGAG